MAERTENSGKARPTGRREEKKARHRQMILDATVRSIAEVGLAGTTVSTVVAAAGLSRGMVNLHFTTKEALFQEALAMLADRYRALWEGAVSEAGPGAEEKLLAILRTDLGPSVLNPEMLGVWVAFRAVAAQQKDLLPLYDTRDKDNLAATYRYCLELLREKGVEGDQEAQAADIAAGLAAMVEGFWVECHLHPDNFDHERALKICRSYLRTSLSL
ncbi:TetR family transcriptional regulator C-terminal domain-containing protein [Rhodovibrionaceae bacterium A322]